MNEESHYLKLRLVSKKKEKKKTLSATGQNLTPTHPQRIRESEAGGSTTLPASTGLNTGLWAKGRKPAEEGRQEIREADRCK